MQSTVTAWHLEMVVPGVHDKFYRIYLVETPNAVSFWFSQWGKRGSFGQWQEHKDGYSSVNMANDVLDAKRSKGYDLIVRKSFKIDSDFRREHGHLSRAFDKALHNEDFNPPPITPDLGAVEQSLKDMLKRAGRGR